MGGGYISLLLLFLASMLPVASAWAQGGISIGGTAGSGPALNVNGYSIAGNDMPALYKEYIYTREMPEGKGVYWNAEGAETINGAAASSYPARSLDAGELQELRVQWNDTATVRKLQLCLDGEKGTEVLAELLVRGISITNKIMYHGQAPNYSPKSRSTAIYLCSPNITADPVTGAVSGNPYHFQFESNCSGNRGPFSLCSFRPSFVWTIQYWTADGKFYEDVLKDKTRGDFSKIWINMFTTVPVVSPSLWTYNVRTTYNYGNIDIAGRNFGGACAQTDPSTAAAGDAIVRVHIECSGYSCGWSQGQDDDAIDIYYIGLPVAPITLVNSAAQSLCRTQSYQVQTAGTAGAGVANYVWTATNGAQVVAIPGVGSSRVSLDLSNVPLTATSITLTVQPAPGSQTCAGANQVSTTVLQLDASPAPQAMQLTNGLCPGTGTKAVAVDLGITPNTGIYEWTISGANATFLGASTTSTATIVTPFAGAVTVSVRKRLSLCASFGPPISTTYQIGNLTPSCVVPLFYPGDGCGNSPRLVFERVPSGLQYFVGTITNASRPGITLTPTLPGSPVWNIGGLGGIGIVTFNLQYNIYNPCPAGITSCSISVSTGKVHYDSGGCPVSAKSSPPAETPLQLYPNPTSGVVNIKADAAVHYQWLKVFDARGAMRYEQQSTSAEGIQTFDTQALAPGIYLVQIFDGEHLTSQRLVKE